MSRFHYRMQWPKDKLYVECFVHEPMNYRYHWHPEAYELNILLQGSQEYCCGQDNFQFDVDDVVLVHPGVGHASFAPSANTCALVLHFSARAFTSYTPKNTILRFADCRSTAADRQADKWRLIRMCAAQVYDAAAQAGPYSGLCAKAGLEMLMAVLCTHFHTEPVTSVPEEPEQQGAVSGLISYMEQHYTERVTLEDLARFSGYNRTYVSTLFKSIVGIGFHEYLTRLRFQHALLDIASSDRKLTDIAYANGFPELKSLTKLFRRTLGRSPAEYRALLSPDRVVGEMHERRYLASDQEIVQQKTREYMSLKQAVL